MGFVKPIIISVHHSFLIKFILCYLVIIQNNIMVNTKKQYGNTEAELIVGLLSIVVAYDSGKNGN